MDVRRLFTDQGDPPHRNCDLFGLSLSWELDGPILLDLLEKNHIPIWSHKRTDFDPLVFGGGPVLTANPEPMAPFFDVILLGDGEELLPTFINEVQKSRDCSRSEQLQALAQIPGIYIPSLYTPKYSNDGKLLIVEPTTTDIPCSIKKQTWKGNTLSYSKVITPDSAWPNIHMVEIVRSCPEMCRFCLASYLTLPFRSPSFEEGLIPAVEKGLRVTKRLGLLGASVTQHPQFTELIKWLNKDQFDDIRLSVSSVRAATVTSELTKILTKRGAKSLTIAIESGSNRIRKLVNKKLSEEEIFEAAQYALEGGLKKLKLYGMVGLPIEEDVDIEATADLLLKLKKQMPSLQLTFGVSTFVPKAQTPFQWCGLRPEADKRLKLLAKRIRPHGIAIRPESFGGSLIQTLFSRSDRRLAPVIASMRGTHHSLGNWKKAYKSVCENNSQETHNQSLAIPKPPRWEEVVNDYWETSRVLPWSHLKGPLPPDRLIEHYEQALNPKVELVSGTE